MRVITAGLLSMALIAPCPAPAESLGAAAEKERARREKKARAEAKARVLTAEDLANTQGTIANDPGIAPAVPDWIRKGALLGADPMVDGLGAPLIFGSTATAEDVWRQRAAMARARVDNAQARYDRIQRALRFGGPKMYENGRRVIYSVHQLKAMGDAAEAELVAARAAFAALEEEGRRAGASPGWFR